MLINPPPPEKYAPFMKPGLFCFSSSLLTTAIERRHARVAFRRIEEGVLHPERIEDALSSRTVEWHPGRDLDDARERVEAGLRAVRPARAGLEVERHAAETRQVIRQRLLALERDTAALRDC